MKKKEIRMLNAQNFSEFFSDNGWFLHFVDSPFLET